MDDSVKFASLNNKEEVLAQISRLEDEISRKTGEDVILIAYANKNFKTM